MDGAPPGASTPARPHRPRWGRPTPRWFRPALAVVAVGALALRVHRVATVTGHKPLVGDMFFFYYWPAVQLARGHGFLGYQSMRYGYPVPGAEQPPGFPLLLAVLHKLGLRSPDEMVYFLCVLGTVTVVLMGVLVARLVSARAGIIAAVITAVYPNVWINDTLLLSESMFLFGLAVALCGAYAFWERPSWVRVAIASAGVTIAASARSEAALLFALVILPLTLGRRELPVGARIRHLAVGAAVPLVFFGPWFVYNTTRFAEPVPLSTGFGQTLMAANCDLTWSGELIGYYSVRCPTHVDPRRAAPSGPVLTDEERARYVTVSGELIDHVWRHGDLPTIDLGPVPPGTRVQDQSVDDTVFRRTAFRYIRAHIRRLPVVVFAREARMLGLWNPAQQNGFDWFEGRGSHRLIVATQRSFWVLGVLAIVGAVLWRRRRTPLYPLGGIIVSAFIVSAITFGLTRYRVGMDLALIPLAALTIDTAIDAVTRRTGRTGTGDPGDAEAPDGPDTTDVVAHDPTGETASSGVDRAVP